METNYPHAASASASASASTTSRATAPAAIVASGSRSTPPSSSSPPTPIALPVSPRKSSRRFNDANASPPSTPPAKPRSTGKGKGRKLLKGPRETRHQRDISEEELEAAVATAARHSHGLSWNSTTRDSVVDNLLFSLDNLSRGDVGEVGGMEGHEQEKTRYLSSLSSHFVDQAQRSRGHTHSSSTSEYDRHLMDSPQSQATPSPKGRRSASTSNFPSYSSMNGRVKQQGRPHGGGRTSSEGPQPALTQPYINGRSFVAKRKDSSDTVSLSPEGGYGAVLETSRLAWGNGGRSVSMDHIQSDSRDGLSVLGRGRPVPSVHSKYESNDADESDAAPEPIISGGPRKMQNPTATGPVYVNQANPKPKPSQLRKTTTQQDLRSQAGNSPSPSIPHDIREQAADFVRTSSMRGSLPPPSASSSTAPSPGISTRRKEHSPPREKPGFFKRIFSSNSSRTVSGTVERPGSTRKDNNDRGSASRRAVSQTSAAGGDVKDATNTANSQPPTLSKKPSSFFRRRKKSTSEAFNPPPIPTAHHNHANPNMNTAGESPSISSLRKVMDPYLNEDETTPRLPAHNRTASRSASRPPTAGSKATASSKEDSEDPDIFHTGYTPPPDASLGARYPISREHSLSMDRERNFKMKIKKRRPEDLANSDAQEPGENNDLAHPSRRSSRDTLRDEKDHLKVSPLSAFHPNVERPGTISRASTGDGIIAASESRLMSQDASPLDTGEMRDFSAGTGVSLNMDDDEQWVVQQAKLERPPSPKSGRLRLQPTASEEQLNQNKDNNSSPTDAFHDSNEFRPDSLEMPPRETAPPQQLPSAACLPLPNIGVDGNRPVSRNSSEPTIIQVPPEFVDEGAEYRERARKIFEGDEEDVPRGDAAAWLGERNTLSKRTLEAYMQLFDFYGMNILASLKMLCSKLTLKGETQQFDRIITALSARWCQCNSNHGFKAQDVVHTIIYSLILLNTDLHLADIGERMSRSAYVKNTLPTIKRVVADAAPNAFDDTIRPLRENLRPSLPWSESSTSVTNSRNPSMPTSPSMPSRAETPDGGREVNDQLYGVTANNKRLSIRPAMSRQDSDNGTPDSAGAGTANALVNNCWSGSMRGWEMEVESILKAFFNSIRQDPLPLHNTVMGGIDSSNNSRNLSVVDLNGNLKRTGSVVSRAPSENISLRSKDTRFNSFTQRWPGRSNRSRPKLYPASTVGSSRTSFDEGSGFWSPAQSSKYSFSKTLTSASVGSFNTQFQSQMDSFKPSIGFAGALNQAMIREENFNSDGSDTFSMPRGDLLEDESLALEGAPWAKEGMVQHKHHLETQDRKAKERSWTSCFAVISKGKLTLFNFNTSSKTQSASRKTPFQKMGKAASVAPRQVGGGDWMDNAEQLDVFILRQTIASTLPPPGYSKARPNVWALSLPSGAVHLFQVGTPEIAEEFMTAANYWSARLSKEPLAGGVSNIEYGWSENIVNPALLDRSESFQHPPSSMQTRNAGHSHSMSTDRTEQRDRRGSLQSSIRNSFDTGFGSGTKSKTSGDRATIMEWQPPTQSMMASQLMEVDQLKQLTAYVTGQEEELNKHQELKHAIELAFSPRHPNFQKAMANWQRKSDHLLREIVKFRTYIDSLTAAQKAKEALYARKADGRLSPVAKDDDVYDLPTMNQMMGGVAPRGIHTSG
ncbi:PH and SEC7 domain-containing protein [Fulvia fulva]|uniref:PH and SEC7 domain-containing protein n=1 Tax=Passalora fulva TaxID=5499 RepID=A0A9Q8UV59_PASFU|nr:PH and SEC7 domain-containing protein [Fulvia fulva]KAK4612205.1 PH and SEC7 domain-containing protein [Fulvia fulva]KAK4612545.1 PH and SEC7 domain-containing protein [Fulvia fulva]UJO23649.1 PH and SEC7 domain-containing protein [Fulvia fulva]WPV21222.1 PH and SEC7 domain-containing protein [Fulvia fulva]WPV36308.1 PH and SEC7 domain-containing protein [Fulvia fulva]